MTSSSKAFAGPMSVALIAHHSDTGRYHVMQLAEHSLPGPIVPLTELSVIRLMSRSHHTTGAATFDEALIHLDELCGKVDYPSENVYRAGWLEWDGSPGLVMLVTNWLKPGHEGGFKPTGLVNLAPAAVTLA